MTWPMSFNSEDKLQLLDPQLALECVKKNPANPGYKILFGSSGKLNSTSLVCIENPNKKDFNNFSFFQYDPYRGFCGFDPQTKFEGTIIRLPFR